MGIDTFFVHPVTILTPTMVEDRYGNLMPDWDDATETAITGWLNDLSSIETLGGRDTVTSSRMLFCAATAPITATDRLIVEGVTYEVDGEPKLGRTPIGPHHLEVTLKAFDESLQGVS